MLFLGPPVLCKELFDCAIAAFNTKQGDESCMIQKAELDGIKLFDEQLPDFKVRLEKHWAAHPVELSAVPRKMLSLRCLRTPAESPCTKTDNETWYKIFVNHQKEKNLVWLRRITTAFQTRIHIKQNTTGKPVKLGPQNVSTFRDMDPAFVHKLACTFYETLPIMANKFTVDSQRYNDIKDKFYKGLLDKPLSEKVKLMDKVGRVWGLCLCPLPRIEARCVPCNP